MKKRQERSFADWLRLLRIAIRPMKHVPFSPGKIRVLRLRAALGLPLFVYGDAPMPKEMQEEAEAPRRRRGGRSPLAG